MEWTIGPMPLVTFFTKEDCSLCRAAWFVVERARRRVSFDVVCVDITRPGNERWYDAYRNDIPVIHLDGREIFRHRVDEARLMALIAESQKAAKEGV